MTLKPFKASGTSSKSSVRTIYRAEVMKKEDERIWIELTGSGFSIQYGKNNCRDFSCMLECTK